MIYAKNFNVDQLTNKTFTDDEECVVFDPDNIHESSTNLSDFLTQYYREDWTPKRARKLKKTAWEWTDDENEMNSLSLRDIGYSSDGESDNSRKEAADKLRKNSGSSRNESEFAKKESEFSKKESDNSTKKSDSSREVSGKCCEYIAHFGNVCLVGNCS